MKKYQTPICTEVLLNVQSVLCASNNPIGDAGEVSLNSFNDFGIELGVDSNLLF